MPEIQTPVIRWKPLEGVRAPTTVSEVKVRDESQRSHWEAIIPIDLQGHISGETYQSLARFVETVRVASGLKDGSLGNVDFDDLGVEIHALTNADAMGLSGWRLKKAGGAEFEATGDAPQPEPEAGEQGQLELTHSGTGSRITVGLLGQQDEKRYLYSRYSLRVEMMRLETKPEESPQT